MDNIRQNLEKITDLSADELSSLKDSILSEYKTVKEQETTREVVETMQELAQAAQAVQAETSRRDVEAAELAAQAEEASSSIAALEDPEPVEETQEDVAEAATSEEKTTENEEEELAEDEEIDPVTGEKRKKKKVSSAPVEDKDQASVNDISESVSTPEEVQETVSETAEASEPIAEAEAGTIAPDTSNPEAIETPDVSDEPEVQPEVEEVSDTSDVEREEIPAEVEVEEGDEAEASETTSDDSEKKDSEEITVDKTVSNEELVVEVPEGHEAQAKAEKAPVTITAGADLPGITAGSPLPDLRAVSQAFMDRRKGMGRTSGGDGEQHLVATFSTSYPDSRILDGNDVDSNNEKITSVTSPEAIVAAGGLLGPLDTRWDLFGLEENLGRPVRDSLAVFQADRGGIRFLTSPVLEDLDGSASVWTIEDDEEALTDDTKVKPCLRISASQVVEVFVDAIPLCLTFGNMGARFYPELVERNTKLAMMWHARYAEQRLITKIGNLSTAVTTSDELGVARDLLVAVEKAAAGYRNRHRMGDDARLRVIFPSWLRNALRADLTKQIPSADADDNINLTEARMNQWFSTRGINVTWSHDGESSQYFAAQAAGELVDFPENVIWYLFAEGTFLFLDGGTLDLGLVRDSTLNATNDYKMFLETFEGVAKVGGESLKVTSPVNLYGATAATVDTIADVTTP